MQRQLTVPVSTELSLREMKTYAKDAHDNIVHKSSDLLAFKVDWSIDSVADLVEDLVHGLSVGMVLLESDGVVLSNERTSHSWYKSIDWR